MLMENILESLLDGDLDIDEAVRLLKADNVDHMGEVANIDVSRELRTGFPEAIFAEGKEFEDLLVIVQNMVNHGKLPLLVTRISQEIFSRLENELDVDITSKIQLNYNKRGKILTISDVESNIMGVKKEGKIGIITAGTSDIPIAEEAKTVINTAGYEAIISYDVGVAGIHRLFHNISRMIKENVQTIIVVAGMEGALPSVVAGLVDTPIIAVPTSVGYGVGAGGHAALNAMLQSCAPGIAVVNIDNGFGAAVFAITILQQIQK